MTEPSQKREECVSFTTGTLEKEASEKKTEKMVKKNDS